MTSRQGSAQWTDLIGPPSIGGLGFWPVTDNDRVVAPMSTGGPISKGQIARITSRAFPHAWLAYQLYVSSAGTRGGAGDWRLRSIRVDGHEKLKEPISGGVFAVGQVWSDVSWKVRAGRRIVMEVEYVGRRRRCAFYAAIVGARLRKKGVLRTR